MYNDSLHVSSINPLKPIMTFYSYVREILLYNFFLISTSKGDSICKTLTISIDSTILWESENILYLSPGRLFACFSIRSKLDRIVQHSAVKTEDRLGILWDRIKDWLTAHTAKPTKVLIFEILDPSVKISTVFSSLKISLKSVAGCVELWIFLLQLVFQIGLKTSWNMEQKILYKSLIRSKKEYASFLTSPCSDNLSYEL